MAQTPQPVTTSVATSAPNFDSIPGHQIHDESIISPATSQESPTSQEIKSLGMIPYTEPEELQKALDHVTIAIENYTQKGRAEHPILSRLGDVTRAAKEYLTGGKSAGQPMGTKYGIINNPVTQTVATVPEVAEDAAKVEAAVKEYGPKVAEHLAETGRNFRQSMGEEVRSALQARAPEGSPEAGKFPIRVGSKPYHEQKYKTSIPVKVTWPDHPDEAPHFDEVKGLNEGHALARAKANWPAANVEIVKPIDFDSVPGHKLVNPTQ